MSQDNKRIKLALCTAGIMIFFLVYGITQEKIMTTNYGADGGGEGGEQFQDTSFLVLVNRVISVIFAISIILWRGNGERLGMVAPARNYAFISLSNFLSTYCQYEALKYVTFPTQTLGKCAKMLPVLVLGSIFQRKHYSSREYLIAFAIMCGCSIFLTSGEVSKGKSSAYDTPFGMALMVGYLAFDGFTSTTQERLFKNYEMSTYNQMLHVNLFSALLSFLVLSFPFDILNSINDILSSSRIIPAIQFTLRHPEMLIDSVILSLCSSFGQLLIYYTIKEFGALVYSTIMTTRQFFGILLSALLFSHPITNTQWLGAIVVFAALYWQTLSKKPAEKRATRKSDDLEEVIMTQDSFQKRIK